MLKYHPYIYFIRDLLLHTNQTNVKSKTIPASTHNTLIAYSFGNTWKQIPKSKLLEQKSETQTVSQWITNINSHNEQILKIQKMNSNTQIQIYQPKNNIIIYSLQPSTLTLNASQISTEWIWNIEEKNKYLKSLLLKEYLINLSISDRSLITQFITTYFENIKLLISEPIYQITPNKIKISFFYYSLYQNLYFAIKKLNFRIRNLLLLLDKEKKINSFRYFRQKNIYKQIKWNLKKQKEYLYRFKKQSYLTNHAIHKKYLIHDNRDKMSWKQVKGWDFLTWVQNYLTNLDHLYQLAIKKKNIHQNKKSDFIKFILKNKVKPQINKNINKNLLKDNLNTIKNIEMKKDKNYLNLLGYVGRPLRHLERGPDWNNSNKKINIGDYSKDWHYWNKKTPRKADKEYIFKDQILKLQFILSKIFNIEVEFEIQKIKHFYLDSTIFNKILSSYNKEGKFWYLTRKIFKVARLNFYKYFLKYSYIAHINRGLPYQLIGMRLRLGGRWVRERTKPKYTIQKSRIGSSATTDHNYTNYSLITQKNKKGIFSINLGLANKNLIHLNKQELTKITKFGSQKMLSYKEIHKKSEPTKIKKNNKILKTNLNTQKIKTNQITLNKSNIIKKYTINNS